MQPTPHRATTEAGVEGGREVLSDSGEIKSKSERQETKDS